MKRPYRTLGLSIIVAVCFVIIMQVTAVKRDRVDWLNQADWSSFSGADKIHDGLKIWPTGLAINHRDTSTAQPNPPVNVRGHYLKVSGDFRTEIKLTGIDNQATLQFYGQVPVIYDEWRQERPSIRLEAKNDGLKVRIWDGTSASSMDERSFALDLDNEVSISLVHKDGNFIIAANGRELGTLPDHGVFVAGTVWFGADAQAGTDGWMLTALEVQSLGKERLELVPPLELTADRSDPNTLRNLSEKTDRRLPIGTAVSIGPLLTDQKYHEIALSQFNMVTPENSFKPQFVHPLPDIYLFHDTDTMVDIAEANKMSVHGHALVMGKANPEWMQKTPERERAQIMTDHITALVDRYKGRVAQWDVVNEPMSEDHIDYDPPLLGIRKQMWFDAMGEEYIDIAFAAARAADPRAKLYLNDFGIENDGQRWDAFLSLIKRLQQRGVPIDGVGFEAHVYHQPADTIDPAALTRHIQILASLGIDSRISEIDVLGDDPEYQAKQYSDVLQVCLNQPTCTSYGVWGITDFYGSTALSDRYPIMPGDSLLWGLDYAPKPALKSLQAVLRQP